MPETTKRMLVGAALLAVLSILVAGTLSFSKAAQPEAESIESIALKILYDSKLDKSVVIVLYNDQYGTGWWVDEHYVVTAGHVVDYGEGTQVILVHGDYSTTGQVVAVDQLHDIAVIYTGAGMPNATILPLCTQIWKGQEVLVVGYPFETVQVAGSLKEASANPRAAFGTIAWVGSDDKKWLAEVQASTDQGNSGGPTVDVDAKCVVGIISFALKGNAGVMYYITDVYALREFLKKHNIPFTEKTPTKLIDSDEWPWFKANDDKKSGKTKYVLAGVGILAAMVLVYLVACRARYWVLAVLALAPLAMLAAPAHAGYTVLEGYENGTIVQLAGAPVVDTGYDLLPGYYVTVNLHAKVKHDCLWFGFSGSAVKAGPFKVAIEAEKPPVGVDVFLRVYKNGEKVYEKHLGWYFCNGDEFETAVHLRLTCEGTLSVESSDFKYQTAYGAKGIDILATPENVYINQVVKEKDCYTPSKTETPPKTGTVTNPFKKNKDDQQALLLALAGVGALSLLGVAIALSNRGSSSVVVVGGKRGMVQLLVAILVVGAVLGGVLAWKLRDILGGSSSNSNNLLLAVAGVGLLVFFFLFLVLMTRSQPQVVVVEGGGR